MLNIWISDGYKEIPADRLSPRARFKKSLDEMLSVGYEESKVYVTLESKVFGIGRESYTVGSAEFCLSYSTKAGITPLMDNGHYHPTEVVSDKISSLLPNCELKDYQTEASFTRTLTISEEAKTLPFCEVWDEYCRRLGAPVGKDWLLEAEKYEQEVLSKR